MAAGGWASGAAPTAAAAFLASLVEAIEALTVVLAVGAVRGWRGALAGSGFGLLVLLLAVVTLGPLLTAVPQDAVRLVVGTLILFFGMRWLRKAVLRSAGVIRMRDEAAAFARETDALRARGAPAGRRRWDGVAFATACQITLLEGVEVVFVVVALGSGGTMVPASLGALAAVLLVIAVGAALHRPIANIPENALKFLVGVLLCGFGCFWVGEGMGIAWPGGDAALFALVAWFGAAALAIVRSLRTAARPA